MAHNGHESLLFKIFGLTRNTKDTISIESVILTDTHNAHIDRIHRMSEHHKNRKLEFLCVWEERVGSVWNGMKRRGWSKASVSYGRESDIQGRLERKFLKRALLSCEPWLGSHENWNHVPKWALLSPCGEPVKSRRLLFPRFIPRKIS